MQHYLSFFTEPDDLAGGPEYILLKYMYYNHTI